VREQAAVIVDRLRSHRSTTFRALVADSPDTVTTVCRFLALLELFRESAVAFDQMTPLGELTIRWTGSDEGEIQVGDEFDAPAGKADESEGSEGSGEDGEYDDFHGDAERSEAEPTDEAWTGQVDEQ